MCSASVSLTPASAVSRGSGGGLEWLVLPLLVEHLGQVDRSSHGVSLLRLAGAPSTGGGRPMLPRQGVRPSVGACTPR